MDRATGPPAEAIVVLPQALVHNHPRTPRTTGRPPALSQAEEIGAAPAHLRRDRARAELAESFGAGRASCRPQTTRTRPGPWSWTALPCRAGTGSTSRARTRAGTTEPGRASGSPAPRPEDPYGCPARPPGSTHDARAPQLTGLLDNPPDTPPLGDEGCIGPGMTTPRMETSRGRNSWTGRSSTTRSSIRHGPRSNEQQPSDLERPFHVSPGEDQYDAIAVVQLVLADRERMSGYSPAIRTSSPARAFRRTWTRPGSCASAP